VGTYNPIPYGLDATKEVRLRLDRIKYWLSVGAQPSDRVVSAARKEWSLPPMTRRLLASESPPAPHPPQLPLRRYQAYLLWRAGLLPAPPIPHTPTRWVPRAQLRELAKAAKSKAAFSTLAAGGAAAPAAARLLAVACAPRTLGVGLGGATSVRAAPCSFAGFARAPALFPLR